VIEDVEPPEWQATRCPRRADRDSVRGAGGHPLDVGDVCAGAIATGAEPIDAPRAIE
jgi:hypothetical protein